MEHFLRKKIYNYLVSNILENINSNVALIISFPSRLIPKHQVEPKNGWNEGEIINILLQQKTDKFLTFMMLRCALDCRLVSLWIIQWS